MKLASRTYTLLIEKHPDGYLAFFPALEGCNTWGRTYEEAVANAEDALALYLETLDQLGEPLPEDKGVDQPISLGVTVKVPIIA
jgi:predicted RNase H-like HicB family nuclease